MCKKKDESNLGLRNVVMHWYSLALDINSFILAQPAGLCKSFELWQLLGDGCWSEVAMIGIKRTAVAVWI